MVDSAAIVRAAPYERLGRGLSRSTSDRSGESASTTWILKLNEDNS
jgi:hypothetical protein